MGGGYSGDRVCVKGAVVMEGAAAVHLGSLNSPLTNIPLHHMMIDELHLFFETY